MIPLDKRSTEVLLIPRCVVLGNMKVVKLHVRTNGPITALAHDLCMTDGRIQASICRLADKLIRLEVIWLTDSLNKGVPPTGSW